jgi:hypothetical protein
MNIDIDNIYYHKYNKYKNKYLLEKNNLIIKGGTFQRMVQTIIVQPVLNDDKLIKNTRDELLKCNALQSTKQPEKNECIKRTQIEQLNHLKKNIKNDIDKNENNKTLKDTIFKKLKLITNIDKLYGINKVDMKNFLLRNLCGIIYRDNTTFEKTLGSCKTEDITKHKESHLTEEIKRNLEQNTNNKYEDIILYYKSLLDNDDKN